MEDFSSFLSRRVPYVQGTVDYSAFMVRRAQRPSPSAPSTPTRAQRPSLVLSTTQEAPPKVQPHERTLGSVTREKVEGFFGPARVQTDPFMTRRVPKPSTTPSEPSQSPQEAPVRERLGRGYSEPSTPSLKLSARQKSESEIAREDIDETDSLKRKLFDHREGSHITEDVYLDAGGDNHLRLNRLLSGIGELVCTGVQEVQWSPMSATDAYWGLDRMPQQDHRPVVSHKDGKDYINLKSLPLMRFVRLYGVKSITLFNGVTIHFDHTDYVHIASIYGELELYAEYGDLPRT